MYILISRINFVKSVERVNEKNNMKFQVFISLMTRVLTLGLWCPSLSQGFHFVLYIVKSAESHAHVYSYTDIGFTVKIVFFYEVKGYDKNSKFYI